MPGAQMTMIDNSLTTFSDFVAAVRARTKATLTEISRVPESFPEAQIVPLPFVLLAVGEDTDVSDNYVVQSEAQQVQVDFVYVAKTTANGAVDETQTLRDRLDVLAAAFLADRRLGGLANRTEQAHTPLLTANQYETKFKDMQIGPVTVMVLSLVFDLVQSTVQYA